MQSNKKYILTSVAVVAIIAVASYLINSSNQSSYSSTATDSTQTQTTTDNTNTVVNTPPVVPTTQNPSPAPKISVYKDGTYSAIGSYVSPEGGESVGVTLTLKSDMVVDSTVTPNAQDGTSANYQKVFISGYKQYVIGKKISDINLTRVSGASLTPQGFNDAISKIEVQAKA